jgi:hypothetical protein
MHWLELQHRTLGGLSFALVVVVGWGGPSEAQHRVEPGQLRSPKRPLDKFLEPTVRLGAWRKKGTMGVSLQLLAAKEA